MQTGRNYLKIQDVANKLSLSKSTIRKYVLDKQIPYIKLNRSGRKGSLLFDEQEIDKWMQDQRVEIKKDHL